MLFNFKSKKIIFAILILLSILIFYALWNVVSGGYDRQNKAILFLKKFIPNKISRKVRDTIFVIPDLKERNKQLSLQVSQPLQDPNCSLAFEVQPLESTLYSLFCFHVELLP